MRVPVYDSPQVASAPVPPVESSSAAPQGAFGEGVAAGLEHASVGLSELEQRAKQAEHEANSISVANVGNKLEAGLQPLVTSIVTSRGDNAFAQADGFEDKFAQLKQKILSDPNLVPNEDVRKVSSVHADRILNEASRQVQTHLAQQRQVVKQDKMGETEATSLDTIQTAGNVETARNERARYLGFVQEAAADQSEVHLRMMKFDQEAAMRLAQKYAGAEDAPGLQKILDSTYSVADDGSTQTVRQALGKASEHYDEVLQKMNRNAQGDHVALDGINKNRQPVTGFVNWGAVTKYVESLPDNQRTEEMWRHLSLYRGLEEESEKEKRSTIFKSAFTAFLKNNKLADVPSQTEAWLRAYDPDKWHELQRMADSWAENAPPTAEQTGAYIKLVTDMARDPDKYRAISADQFNRDNFGLGRKLWLDAGRQFAVSTGKPEQGPHLDPQDLKTMAEIFERKYQLSTTNADKWPEDKQGMWRMVEDYVGNQSLTWKKNHSGKPPDQEQIQNWMYQKVGEVTVKGGRFWGLANKTVPRIEWETDPDLKGKELIMTDEDRKQLRDRFAKKGIPNPTEAQLQSAFDALNAALGAK